MESSIVALLGLLNLACLVLLVIDVWCHCPAGSDRLLWFVAIIGLGITGSMLYLADMRTRVARGVVLGQAVIVVYLHYLLATGSGVFG